ncbi:MAG: hypothetical protein DMF63_14250 [Acidobacteria bacterium]|nr:MAG: hypothetical protein DMF63_14250 [Acidobacteriota bacterium]
MTTNFLRTFFLITLFSIAAHADTFEFINFTPPVGWTKQDSKDGVVYKRATGIGAVSFYNSYPTTGAAADEFEKTWQTRLGSIVPGGAPRPKLDRDGDYAVAIGGQQINAQDAVLSFSMITFVGRGRGLSVVTVTAGDEVQREITAFLNTISIGSGAAGATNTSDPFEVEFDVPSGYLSIREGGMIILTPVTVNDQSPCAYGIAPARNSSGNLEADARSAVGDVMTGWQIKNDRYEAMKGFAAAGWPYYWFRTDIQRLVGSSYEYASVMTMAFPASSGRVIVRADGQTTVARKSHKTSSAHGVTVKTSGWRSINFCRMESMNSASVRLRVLGFLKRPPRAHPTENGSFADPSSPSRRIFEDARLQSIESAYMTSSSQEVGHVRCRYSTKLRSRRSKFSTCVSNNRGC